MQAKGHKELVTVIGSSVSVAAGEWIQATGSWVQDRQHGMQFKCAELHTTPPTTLEGIQKYLGSGLIKGIGPVYAGKLVKAFGEKVLTVIAEEPETLRSVAGIGPFRVEKIISGWAAQKAIREIMLFLHRHGVSTARAVRIYKTYGDEAIALIRENPYRLAHDIHGIGFLSADKVAESLGIEKSSLIRARAGVSYALSKALDQGHCGLPIAELIASCMEFLGIDQEIVLTAITHELGTRSIIKDSIKGSECIFLSGLYAAEKGIVERLNALIQPPLPWSPIDTPKVLEWIEQKNRIELSISQKQALAQALTSKVTIITGGPGVGKTTLLKSILQILHAKQVNIALCAPTGRAAKRMSEATEMEAKTLHRLLEVNPHAGGFMRNEHSPLVCDLVVVDEASMVDVPLMYALLKAIPPHAAGQLHEIFS